MNEEKGMVRTEIQLFLKNAPGELGKLSSMLSAAKINIDAMTIQDTSVYWSSLFDLVRFDFDPFNLCIFFDAI